MNFALKELTLELTQRCLQNCVFCSSNSYRSNDNQLSFEIVKQVLDDFYYLGGEVIEVSGGEPLLYPYVNETIDYASKIGLQIHLFTCAYLLDKQIDVSKLSKVDRFYLNLQAPSKSIHDYLTKTPGSFDRVVSLIKTLKAKGKWVGTHFIPLSPNISEIEEYIEFARLLKLDNVSLLRFVPQGRGKNLLLRLNSDEILHLFSTIEKFSELTKPEFKVGCPLDFRFIFKKSQSAIPCKSGISRCVIRPNGNVVPCPAFKDTDDFVAGNVNHNSLINIWNKSPVLKKIRNYHNKRIGGLCAVCSFWEVCRGRCQAQRVAYYGGDPTAGPDPYCPLCLPRTQE